MKILEFTLPVPANKSIIIKEEKLPNFYPYLHRHNEVQLTWIIDGEGTLVAGNNMHNFHSDEIFWIGANQPHVFKSDPSYFENNNAKRTHSIDIFFSVDAQLSPFFSIPELKQLKQFINQQNHGFRIPKNKIAEASAKIKKISTTDGVEQFLLFINLLKTLSSIEKLEPLSTKSEISICNDNEGIRIANIYNFIMRNYKEPITLEQVSKLAYMTPQAFCRYFKKHTHNTLVGFVNQVRINEACKQLMENGNDTIASIAYNTGFNSITNFNRVFKSVVKKSPKEFLRSYMRQVS
ncbi:AraC family transcriptional regulator [Parafilimonas sp.]|uniref:AraC family transcriptional regulator n=1 Tax=Parafilimonas sp. TaxID=1969739 RepID=UPI0039E4CED8